MHPVPQTQHKPLRACVGPRSSGPEVRCSRGLSLKRAMAGWAPEVQKGESKFEIPCLDADAAFMCQFDQAPQDMTSLKNAFIQALC